jgi:tRNA threonylcarbamoyladenosine biosynthesis protein TsaE
MTRVGRTTTVLGMSAGESTLRRTTSAGETEAIGAAVAAGLRTGDVVLVLGELGAGKTTFVRGAARALGVTGPVTSPTFTIGQRYPSPPALVPVSHLDLYRIADLGEEDPELLADYLRPDSVAFVEWPQGAEAELAGLGHIACRIELRHAGGDVREVEIS